MTEEKRTAKDASALSDLDSWRKCLSLELRDNGCGLQLRLFDRTVAEAIYMRPWIGIAKRSRGAAARELIRFISGGGRIQVTVGAREYPAAGGGTFYENRIYEFKIPKSSSPAELELKLAAIGWRPPDFETWERT